MTTYEELYHKAMQIRKERGFLINLGDSLIEKGDFYNVEKIKNASDHLREYENLIIEKAIKIKDEIQNK